MSTANLYGRETCSSDMYLEAQDSAALRTGFLNFLNEYRLVCDDNWTYEMILGEARRRWSVMSQDQRDRFCPNDGNENSFSDGPNQSSSLKSVAVDGEQLVDGYDMASAVSGTSYDDDDDGGFGQFLEEYTMQASEAAARHWDKMSNRERAEYAPKDDFENSSSFASFATAEDEDFVNVDDPVSPPMRDDYMFGSSGCEKKKRMKCSKPKRKSCSKPKRHCASKHKPKCASKPKCAPKPRCPKPRAARKCAKPKAKRCPKPRSAKMCPKPKAAKRCPKPKPSCPITCNPSEDLKTKDQEPTKDN